MTLVMATARSSAIRVPAASTSVEAISRPVTEDSAGQRERVLE